MGLHMARCLSPILCLAFLMPACSTTSKPDPDIAATPVVSTTSGFHPLSSVSRVRMDTGRYPNLFSSESYGLWVDETVIQAKLRKDTEAGVLVDASLVNDAEYIAQNYIVIECRLESLFPDTSIAYDVVGLRNIDIYLQTPDGGKVRPIQRILGAHADERQVGALKRFGRTNVLIFAKEDILAGTPILQGNTEAVRMVVDGFNSNFYFQWDAAPPEQPLTPTEGSAGKLGFSDLYSQLRVLARNF